MRYILICILTMIGLSYTPPYTTSFIFQEFDRSIIDIWLSEDKDDLAIYHAVKKLQDNWLITKKAIEQTEIEHFDHMGFIEDQNIRIKTIADDVYKERMPHARKEAYILLNEFKEVRVCFTTDEYRLDAIIDSYDAYLSVHKIIHDPMMELYEWYEFIWFVDQLKCKVELLDVKLFAADHSYNLLDVETTLRRVNECLKTLDDSLGDAYRPEFEMPCSELHGALKDLFKVFRDKEII